MTRTTQNFVFTCMALALAGALLLTDRAVPEWLYGAIGVFVGAFSVPRPGDTSPTELARVLEANDPTSPEA